MPALDTTGNWFVDEPKITSLMAWPNEKDEAQRQHFVAARLLRTALIDKEAGSTLSLTAAFLDLVLQAPSWATIQDSIAERNRKGSIAGCVFIFMFLMDRCSEFLPLRGAPGASLSKAYFLASKVLDQYGVRDVGQGISSSKKYVENCWLEFKPVAHLWAAIEWNHVAPIGPTQGLLTPAYLLPFLQVAAWFQTFGMQLELPTKNRHASPKLLDGQTSWWLDTTIHCPNVHVPNERAAFTSAPFFAMLKKYPK